ncbi:uncharacterized protein TrAtP1_009565 [Trichoderma atroviride]|uniref:uncharacterized protein n=1 Tax=Hypocrea atroviridis TaxID=63577 RepID=UPI003325749C|nr:hypothetical protein TrAtP1_009565 [Trichoderma atroviride]
MSTAMYSNPMNHPGRRLVDGLTTKVITQLANHQSQGQHSVYRIVQGGSTFTTNFKIGENCSLDQGNKIQDVLSEGIKQDGSNFGGEIEGVKSARISQGNEINGQKAEARENNSAELELISGSPTEI